ncbi:glycosyltransferase family 2 protein [Ochrobactrum soli]|uniref:Glycosyltransferase family 2 protein n=1 Tax=Ochrobactrum soli TaxID=2448455 RepID=A0A849KGL3_9HYPH|nr:glycosyltransferase family 2 protein [[Ochrobactrum] soli]NNU58807.1 glycosyltransferase family 2 protein [[Ochrobactrum] soli]
MKSVLPPMHYPALNETDWAAYWRASSAQQFKLRWRHARLSVPRKRGKANLIASAGSFAALLPDDLPLICVVRNAAAYLNSFLRYYRALGVTRFIVVDDKSDDGTAEILANAADVDLFVSDVRYAEADRGRAWRDALFNIYGRRRWYLSVDADEFFVFPRMEQRSLRDFIGELEAHGIRRCLAPMIDMYPAGLLRDGVFVDDGTKYPFEVSSHFDGDGYTVKQERFGVAVRGGPRQRLFGRSMRLSKFPLIWVDRKTDYRRGSIHGPGPCFRNYLPVTGALLHYRFSSRSVEEFQRIAKEGGHAGGSEHYKAIVGNERFSDDLSLVYSGSVHYTGPECLVERGFMVDLQNLTKPPRMERAKAS